MINHFLLPILLFFRERNGFPARVSLFSSPWRRTQAPLECWCAALRRSPTWLDSVVSSTHTSAVMPPLKWVFQSEMGSILIFDNNSMIISFDSCDWMIAVFTEIVALCYYYFNLRPGCLGHLPKNWKHKGDHSVFDLTPVLTISGVC